MASPWRAARQAQGLTLTQLAALADLHPSCLSRFERGVGGLRLPTIRRLADALGLHELATTLAAVDDRGGDRDGQGTPANRARTRALAQRQHKARLQARRD